MGFKDRLMQKVGSGLEKSFEDSVKEIAKNLKILENHLITVQENQVETEQYLKEIRDLIKNKKQCN